ncbi:MAG: glycosyltransferase [Chloroflexi bacterium]|nr:glycosyltransferase [Chloroflexota bacterium]
MCLTAICRAITPPRIFWCCHRPRWAKRLASCCSKPWAAGKPVIASNLPGVRTVVNSGVDGFLAAPNDVDDLAARIRDMLDAGDRRKVMGRAGRDKVVAKYDWSRINERLVDVYREVVDGRR